jgi:hypothetical protein
MNRFRDREEMAFLRAGIVASTIANCNRDPKTDPFTPQDFMPSMNAEPTKEPTREEVIESMRQLNSLFGGEDMTNNASTR